MSQNLQDAVAYSQHWLEVIKKTEVTESEGKEIIDESLTRTSRNQKGRGKVAQGVTCQRQEKGEKREAYPTATFPRAYCSRM